VTSASTVEGTARSARLVVHIKERTRFAVTHSRHLGNSPTQSRYSGVSDRIRERPGANDQIPTEAGSSTLCGVGYGTTFDLDPIGITLHLHEFSPVGLGQGSSADVGGSETGLHALLYQPSGFLE